MSRRQTDGGRKTHEHPDFWHQQKLEFDRVCQAVGGWQALVDETAKDQDTLALLRWLDESQQADKLFENQQLLRQPIVRNGRAATVGYRPEVWEKWE